MRIVITGGAGFVGLALARRILERGKLRSAAGDERVDQVVLFDTPSSAPVPFNDERVTVVRGNIADQATVRTLIDRADIAVFHLASVVSGGAELDFDLAMNVNLHGHLHLLEALRALPSCPKYVFASSIAVYGGADVPKHVADSTRHVPQTTYGMTKAVGELLVNDFTRKGFIDGRSARLPAVIVRPGAPNKAASGFVSGVIREPLNGVDIALPVSLDTGMVVTGYRDVVDNLIALFELDGARLGDDRALNLPNRAATLRQMVESMQRVSHGRKLGAVSVAPDPFVEKIVATWPTGLDATRAETLGLAPAGDLESIIAAYMDDYLA